MKKRMKRRMALVILLLLGMAAFSLLPSVYVMQCEKAKIITAEQAAENPMADCAVILGAGVRDGKPTPMLRDRLLTGIALYQNGSVKKLLVSGDHGTEEYDEVGIMKTFAVEHGVPDSDIFMDHAGFSTYETMYRAKVIFEARRIVVVTQTYHLYRALYDAERLGLEAMGVSADLKQYRGQLARDMREVLARDKDFLWCLVQPKPTYLGEKIPVSGDGNETERKGDL